MIAVTDSILIGAGQDNKVLGPGNLFASHSPLAIRFLLAIPIRKCSMLPASFTTAAITIVSVPLFVDGHVEANKVADLFDPKRPEVRRRWHFDNRP